MHPHLRRVRLTHHSGNDFCLHLYPYDNPDFKHLVTLNLVQANQDLVGIIEFITEGIGRFVKAHQGTDPRRILVVVETTLKLFPAHEQFHLEGSDITKVLFDCRGRNLRCCFCFSYGRLSSQCHQHKPSLFSSPEYTVDVVTMVTPVRGRRSRLGGLPPHKVIASRELWQLTLGHVGPELGWSCRLKEKLPLNERGFGLDNARANQAL